MSNPAGQIISTILRHDDKQTSYKIALLRAINDVVLSFPDLRHGEHVVTIPLRVLAEFWLAYYWPFVDPLQPILQGRRADRGAGLGNDMAFRPALADFRAHWDALLQGQSRPSDGFFIMNEMRLPRKRTGYPPHLLVTYDRAIRSISQTLRMPIQHAGPGEWSVFPRPRRCREVANGVAIPGTRPDDLCLQVQPELWRSFQELSLWVEALCIHEWCLFTERVERPGAAPADRGDIYRLLTARPDNRRPLTWERNNVDILLLEGHSFICPWTGRQLAAGSAYDMDHLLPVSVYPINELWNLVPADPAFNSKDKRERLPSRTRLLTAQPRLVLAYENYEARPTLSLAMHEDAALRFIGLQQAASTFTDLLAQHVVGFIEQVALARNLSTF